MTGVLGRSLILLALLLATVGAVVAVTTGRRPRPLGWTWTRGFAYAFSAAMVAANGVMLYALLAHDFSVSYVAQVGSLSVPTWVTVVSLWSSLEGSILFWGLVLAVYVAVATFANRDQQTEHMAFAVGVWLACGAFFSLLLAGPAQPFLTLPRPPLDGPGPNPLLQNHVLMAAHPPCLYAGYVGMTIPFGLACAALLVGRLNGEFLRSLRTWLLVPWIFLTVAIVLGGWWAYEVLGWGGYWAWDPVENASLLPWLTATAGLHSAILTERKGVLKGWTLTLVLATFLLTILGTFMTRSGVFNSVHSFTQSAIGPTLLSFLAAALLFSVVLLALRIDRLASERPVGAPGSREAVFLLNNLVLVLLTFTVLVGTVFPLVVEAVRGTQMSVGRPYFDAMAVPLGTALLFLMGVGPALPWGASGATDARRALGPPLLGAALLAAVGFTLGVRNPWTVVTLAFGGYAAQVTLRQLWQPLRQLRRGRRRFGAYAVHAGAVIVIVSVAVSSTMGSSKEVRLRRGETARLGAYRLTFLRTEEVAEPHRHSLVARIAVTRGSRDLGVLSPRMNQYDGQRQPIGTPAVRTFPTEDLYLSALSIEGEELELLVLVKPMVGWIWAATGLMALGGLVALLSPVRPRGRGVRLEVAPPVIEVGALVEGAR